MKIYTFYAYKGGVGRSMALANIAKLFRRDGNKVLMVDWDLEAPGLERFFGKDTAEKLQGLPGLVDLVLDYKEFLKRKESPALSIEKYVHPIIGNESNPLFLMPSGYRANGYFQKYANIVRGFDWEEFINEWQGEIFFEWLRQELRKYADVVLIDSRTGVSELSGFCTYHLADVVVMLCAASDQCIDGTVWMAKNFLDPELMLKRNQRPLEVLVIPSRVDDFSGNEGETTEFLSRLKSNFGKPNFGEGDLKISAEEMWDFYIPHLPKYAFKETVAIQDDADKDDRTDRMIPPMKRIYRRLCERAQGSNIWVNYWKSINTQSTVYSIQDREIVERNERDARQMFADARHLYRIAQARQHEFKSTSQRVELIPEFAQACEYLEVAALVPSTATDEISRLKGEIRKEWRQVYLDNISQALDSTDIQVLESALLLRNSLLEANLIDNQESNKLLQKYEAQYRIALRGQIVDRVAGLARRDLVKAQQFLKTEIHRLNLDSDHDLVNLLLDLYWQSGDLQEIEQIADVWVWSKESDREVWKGLVRARQSIELGDMPMAYAEFQQLEEQNQDSSFLLELIKSKKTELKQRRLDQLIAEANVVRWRNTPDYIKAAQLYSLASDVNNEDKRVIAGLGAVGKELSGGLEQLERQTASLRLEGQSLETTVLAADELYNTLDAIRNVEAKLHLEAGAKALLERSYRRISAKRQQWREVLKHLTNARQARALALGDPELLDANDPERGGWNFSLTEESLEKARVAAQKDRECQRLVDNELARVAGLKPTAHELKIRIQNLWKALKEEDFNGIVQKSDELDNYWHMAALRGEPQLEQMNWGGLEQLIGDYYPWYDRFVNQLAEHKILAIERKKNLKVLQDWVSEVQKTHNAIQSHLKSAGGSAFEEMREKNTYNLEQIRRNSQSLIRLCDEFEKVLAEKPDAKPLSRKAEEELYKVSDQWFSGLKGKDGYCTRATACLERAEAEQKRFDNALKAFKGVWLSHVVNVQRNGGKVTLENLRLVEAYFKIAEEIDPQHREIVEYRAKLRDLRIKLI